MINVKICLRKWGRSNKSGTISVCVPPLPGVASREIPAEMHYTWLEWRRRSNSSLCFKKDGVRSQRVRHEDVHGADRPIAKAASPRRLAHLPPYFSPARTRTGWASFH